MRGTIGSAQPTIFTRRNPLEYGSVVLVHRSRIGSMEGLMMEPAPVHEGVISVPPADETHRSLYTRGVADRIATYGPLLYLTLIGVSLALVRSADRTWQSNQMQGLFGVSDGLVLTVVFAGFWILMRGWMFVVPDILAAIDEASFVTSGEPGAKSTLVDECHDAIRSPLRFVMLAVVIVPPLIFSIWRGDFVVLLGCAFSGCPGSTDTWNPPLARAWLLIIHIMPTIFALSVGAIAWPLIAISNVLTALPHRKNIVVRPWHPDRSGGLAAFGQLCVLSACPAVFVGLGIALIPLDAYLGISAKLGRLEPTFEAAAVATVAAMSICMLSLVLIFFRPLSSVHRVMMRSRNAYDAWVSQQIDRVEDALKRSADRDDWDGVAQAVKRLDVLRPLATRHADYPVWPMPLRVAYGSIAAQLVGMAAPVVPTLLKSLRG